MSSTATYFLDMHGHSLESVRSYFPDCIPSGAPIVLTTRDVDAFRAEHCSRCWWCGAGWHDRDVKAIECDHIIGGCGRSNERCNDANLSETIRRKRA